MRDNASEVGTGETPGELPWWPGLPPTALVAVLWMGLALNEPTTTYHFAPAVFAGAWPVARRVRAGHALGVRAAVVASAGGSGIALVVTAVLAAQDALAGPTFFGNPGAVTETLVMILVGAVGGMLAMTLRRQ